MKKLNIPSYILRTKWIVLLLITLFLFVFARTVNSPALTKTAIVLGAGIDFDAQNQQFVVTTQSVLMAASAGDSSSAQSTYQTFTCTGNTIASALDDIAQKMGLIISLAHCNVLVLSTEALKLDHLQLLYPLTGMFALREQTMVVSCEGSPKDLLALRIGTTISAPYFLQSALTNKEGTDGLIRTSVKDLLARSLSRSEAVAIPYISYEKMPDQPEDQQGQQKDNYQLNLSRTLVFNHTDNTVLDKDLSEVLALYLSTISYGSLNYKAENGETVEFKVLGKKVKTKANGRNVTAQMQLSVDLLDVQFVNTDTVLTGADGLIRQAADNLGKQLEDRLNRLYALSLERNIDFLGLMSKAYQSVGRELEKDCLNTIRFTPTVTLSVREAA